MHSTPYTVHSTQLEPHFHQNDADPYLQPVRAEASARLDGTERKVKSRFGSWISKGTQLPIASFYHVLCISERYWQQALAVETPRRDRARRTAASREAHGPSAGKGKLLTDLMVQAEGFEGESFARILTFSFLFTTHALSLSLSLSLS